MPKAVQGAIMIFNIILCVSIVLIYLLTRIGKGSTESKNKVFLLITFILLFILVASRELTVGSDTQHYLALFNKCDTYKWSILGKNAYYEPGYLVFNVLLTYLHITPRIFICIMAFIFNFAVYKFIKDNSKNYLMSVLMFITLLFFYQSMTMMRQFLALSVILLFGFKYAKEKKLIKFILSIVFAMVFHSSALIALFIYPILNVKYNRKMVLLIIGISLIGSIFLSQIYPFIASILNKEAYYTDTIGEAKLGNIISTLIYSIMYLFSLFVVKLKDRQKNGSYLYSLLFAAAICFISITMAVLSRASQYYAILSIIALPNIIEANIHESKLVMQTIIVSLLITYSSVIMINKPEWNTAFNYKTCLAPGNEYICE